MIEEIEQRIVNDFHRDLLKSRGEKLVNCEEFFQNLSDDNLNIMGQVILTFEDTEQIDIENTYKVQITATNMDFNICDCFNNPVDNDTIIGKRLLDYGEIHFDTFNKDTSGILRAKLVFEEDYEIKVDGYNLLITEFVE